MTLRRSTRSLFILFVLLLVLNIYTLLINVDNFPRVSPVNISFFPPTRPISELTGKPKRVHDRPYENAWIVEVDKAQGLVTIRTMESKITVAFEVPKYDMADFHQGYIAPVTLECTKTLKGKCTSVNLNNVFISGKTVKVRELSFPRI